MIKPPHVFECRCGTIQNSADAGIPIGWSTYLGTAWCPDCTSAGVAYRDQPKPATGQRARRAA